MNIEISVENIKCGGCANLIKKKMLDQPEINDITIDIESGMIKISGNEHLRDQYATTLLGLGYPEKGSVEGLQSAGAKAKSFVSCAVGRMGS